MERPAERPARWNALATVAAIAAPTCTVVWLGVTLTAEPATLAIAILKIVFTILVVQAAIAGLRWYTASGIALAAAAVLAMLWVVLRAPKYTAHGALWTVLLLIVPLAVCGILLVLAGGFIAGTWPPRRLRQGP